MSGMNRVAGPSLVALAFAAFLGSLSLVAWRQARALEVLQDLEEVRSEEALAAAELTDLERRVRYLESRGRIVPEARDRLGMHVPMETEIVYLPGEAL